MAFSENHILISRVTVKPTEAEAIVLYNPTSDDISLSNYYITDENEYYKLQTEDNPDFNASTVTNFSAQFPDIKISSNDSLYLMLSSDYKSFYGEDFEADLVLNDSMIELVDGSFGLGVDKLDDLSEMVVLFSFEPGDATIQDIDYFLWGGINDAIDKT